MTEISRQTSGSYGQYCPLALALELLGRRWTLLVVSRVIDGCHRFNEIHRGVPRMSPSLLSRRLGELEEAGVLVSSPAPSGRGREWNLTEAGRELDPLIMDLAAWGQRWARDMELEDLDPAFLVWSIHTRVDLDAMPGSTAVIEFEFSGAPTECRRFWLVREAGSIEMCLQDPECSVDLLVRADLRRFVEAWRGLRCIRREVERGSIRLLGDHDLGRTFPRWMLGSALGGVPRLRPGREQRIATATED